MSGIRISQFKKPKSIIVDQARVDSSYGPKSSILLETLATNFSKNGFTIEVKGLSRDSLLNGMFVTIPVDIRWRANTTAAGVPDTALIVSEYCDQALSKSVFTAKFGQDANANQMNGQAGHLPRTYDSLCIRPNAFKCIRNATLSINGSSFSTRTDAYYTALCKLFCDGRQEEITGAAYESYPYSNCGDARQLQNQRGWFERCKNLNSSGRVKKVSYATGSTYNVQDVIFTYDIKFPIWFGPFTHLGFPGLSGFDGQTVSSIPYVSDLVLECTFTDDVIMDAFAGPDTAKSNVVSSFSPFYLPEKAADHASDWAPDSYNMWQSCKIDSGAGLTFDAGDATKYVCLKAPKLCYMFSEPDPEKMSLASIYTLPSYRFITYEDRKQIQKDSQTVNISFPYIRLSNISSLYICMAEGARVDVGDGVASRSGRYSKTTYDSARLGIACANRSCPIKWDTVKVSMSTSSSVLSNFVQNTITEQRQYELFQKYSANAMALTFEQWQQSSQMLLFSAEELCGIGAFANSFQALTLSVSFDVYRDVTDTGLEARDFFSVGTGAQAPGPQFQQNKGISRPRAVVGRLICMEPELVSISEGAVSVEQVKLSQQEIHNQLMGGAPEVEDANQLDTLAR